MNICLIGILLWYVTATPAAQERNQNQHQNQNQNRIQNQEQEIRLMKNKIHSEDSCSGIEVVVEVTDGVSGRFCQSPSAPAISPPDSQVINNYLKGYVEYLKGFVLETLFNVHAFEVEGAVLGKELSEIQELVENMPHRDPGIIEQLNFSKRMYQAMVNSIELLKYYESIEKAGRHFVCSVIDLNVRVLALRDSHGRPDFEIENLAVLGRSYMQYLSFLKQGFENGPAPSFGKQMMFDTHFSRARESLTDLISHFPKGEEEQS